LHTTTPHEAEIFAGANGQFDVLADGKLVFSKERAHRFPEHNEIIESLT
jgi:selT/selW/selH-like putative selenoprotein